MRINVRKKDPIGILIHKELVARKKGSQQEFTWEIIFY
jgi:hypothetical protein